MAAGIATLSVLKSSDYAALEARVEAFAAELESILRGKGVPVTVNRLAPCIRCSSPTGRSATLRM